MFFKLVFLIFCEELIQEILIMKININKAIESFHGMLYKTMKLWLCFHPIKFRDM